ncbi:MAG: rRNA maturation RNase YbeY [Vicingaceae bacterium]
MAQIHFHSVDTDFKVGQPNFYHKWLLLVFEHFNYHLGEINFIFCNDEYLLELNKKHLAHDYYTDIITFDYVVDRVVSGDLFISVDRLKDNANQLKVDFKDELDRVMAHGLLHLMGYSDNTEAKQREIRAQEDFCLTLRSEI